MESQHRIGKKDFFDHVLRSEESYQEKWRYVRQNPVRARLVKRWRDWPFGGRSLIWNMTPSDRDSADIDRRYRSKSLRRRSRRGMIVHDAPAIGGFAED